MRSLDGSSLSDSTLRYELLEAALLSRRFAPLLALNEPEDSFQSDLLAPLGVRGAGGARCT